MHRKLIFQGLVLVFTAFSQAQAQLPDHKPVLSASELKQLQALEDRVVARNPTVAIRVSTEFLNKLISEPFVVTSPVKTTFQGAAVSGTATFRGKSELCFESLRNNAPLKILLNGQIATTTSAVKGPAVVNNRATTTISGGLQLDFDGRVFTSTPISVDACTTSRLDSVCSKSRFASRLVQQVARRRAEQSRAASNCTASQRAKQQIESEGNQALRQAIAKINRSYRFDETIQSIFAGLPEPTLQISSNESYIQSLATTSEEVKVSPPRERILSDAVMELWIYAEADRPIVKEVEELWTAAEPELEQLLGGFHDVQSRLDELVSQRRVGDWIVLEVASTAGQNGAIGTSLRKPL